MEETTILTKALLEKGMDYEVTLKGSEVGVRLFDRLTGHTLGTETSDSLEKALAYTVASILSRYPEGYVGLSRL